ncbi:MAG: phospholipase D family protein, partial [Oscillospiraceae bacterium]|nr:phospholipase D family protein [Oscillospiraceae bacterium]
MIELLTDNHLDKILDLFDGTKKNIKIISPFVQLSMVERLCSAVNKGVTCTFITRFYVEDMINKASSIDALEMMINNGIEVYALKKLHTKLYLFDNDNAILGSANFTNGGFKSNIELSLMMTEEAVIKELHDYFDEIITQLKQTSDS